MKTMKFRGFKADMIIAGTKTSSVRLFDDKNLQTGDELELINFDTGKAFARAVITEIIEKPLKDISDADLVGHEPFSDVGVYEGVKKYYEERVTPYASAKIVRFRITTLL